MEMKKYLKLPAWLVRIYWHEPAPFSGSAPLNRKRVIQTIWVVAVVLVLVLLVLPTAPAPTSTYQSKGRVDSAGKATQGNSPTAQVTPKTAGGFSNVQPAGDYRYMPAKAIKGSNSSGSMIVTRGGLDLRTQVPPGSRLRIRLLDRSVLGSESLPIIGAISADFSQDGELVIQAGAKVFGEATFDGDSKAQFNWKAIQMPDGRERPFAAVGASSDGELGVAGDIHSNAFGNSVGEALTQFVGAFAQGSMQTGIFGQNPGGQVNGLRNAVAETAKDRAQGFGNDLQKEKRWIELPAGSESYAVLTQAFTFRDPGGSR